MRDLPMYMIWLDHVRGQVPHQQLTSAAYNLHRLFLLVEVTGVGYGLLGLIVDYYYYHRAANG